jgi:hypothetical protein
MLNAFGNTDNDPFLLKYPIDSRNPPVAAFGDSAVRRNNKDLPIKPLRGENYVDSWFI